MKLYLKNGPKAGSSWELTAPGINIGRENDNDIQILIGGVSRYHAKVTPDGTGKWQIQDLGSTNGTKVNGKQISSPVILREGDIIVVGDQQLAVIETLQTPAGKPKEKSIKINVAVPTVTQQETPATASPAPASAPAPARVSPSSAGEMELPPEKNPLSTSITYLGDIFAKKSASSRQENTGTSGEEGKKKKVMGNLVFTVLVIALAAVALAIFIKINEPKKLPERKPTVSVVSNVFCAVYEKREVRSDAVFRFAMSLEGDQAVFSVDEHKARENISYKYASSPMTVDKESLKKLQKALKNTSFMKLTQEPPSPGSRGTDKLLRITIVQDNNTNTISVQNSYPQKSFSETAAILENFIEEVSGIRTVSMSVEEMRNEAEKSFRTAENLFENYQANPQNLRKCISRYQFVATLLERFQPRPPMWQEAKEKAAKAKEILNRILKTTYDDMMIQYKLNNTAVSLQKARILLDYMSPDSKNYEKIRSLKIELERELAQTKRRK